MKKCVLDGGKLADAAAIYRALADVFRFPDYFGANPDALWDALGEYSGEPVEIAWLNTAHSAELLGTHFGEIVAVLQKAAAEGKLTLHLG